ncbi:MAG: hypothetical protein IKE22_08315, partial [Atopobiaceae bacterium]|nr:hypothetical protein [Atopobiaceae bacterium]
QVRRARRSLSSLGADGQATLDVLIVAGDDEFTDEERAEIIGQSSKGTDWATWKAREIREAHKRAQRLAALRAAMPDGIEFHDGERPAQDEGQERLTYVCTVRTAKEGRELALEGDHDHHAYVDGASRNAWCVYRVADEGEGAVSAKEAKAAAEREERDRKLGLMGTMRYSMMEFVCDAMGDSSPMEALPMTCAKVMEARRPIGGTKYSMDFVCLEREGDIQACEPSPYEVVMWLDREVGGTDFWWNTPWAGEGYASSAKRTVALVWDALVTDGWVPPKGIAEVRDACGKVEDK